MKETSEEGFFERLLEILDEETQNWWAEKISVSQGTISNLYKKKYTTFDKIIKILKVKEISATWLIYGVGPKELRLLDDKKIGDLQDNFRNSQEKIAELEYSNLKLKKKIKSLENAMNENELFSHSDNHNINILGLLTVLKMANDVIFKMAEVFAKENIDISSYNEILIWFKKNFDVQKHSTAAALENLNSIIKFK